MKKLILALCLMTTVSRAQEKCLSEILFHEEAKNDPSMQETLQRLEEFTRSWIVQNSGNDNRTTSTTPTYIIPVVFHVIHRGGLENISDAQIYDQLTIINQDYRRLNPDKDSTYTPFKPFAADCDIEFRLAQLDSNGNCTTGINRIYSQLTVNARQNVKSLIDWPRNKYLNIWVVASIENTSGIAGNVLGFASFPGPNAALDGIVGRADYIGNIGTALNRKGRMLTHEAGHWLNLYHIWGDENNCAKDDSVSDTPLQATYTFSTCPTSPYFDACQPTGNGIMFQNYMDYTDPDCMNIFSQGQAGRMHATLNFTAGLRDSVVSPSNLIATGTDGTPAVLCAPVADFLPKTNFICEGSAITFNEMSWGGADTARLWNFPSGTPSTDTSAQPMVTYSIPGQFDVSLTAFNSAGSNTKTYNNHVIVSPNTAAQSAPFSEGFENGIFPFNDWYIINDNGGSNWEVTPIAAASGNNSITIDNMASGFKGFDEFITPAIDFTNVTNISMSFSLAFAYKSAATNSDILQIAYSTNCGKTWTPRRSYSGTTLPTITNFLASAFTPNQADWRVENITFPGVTVSTKPNVRFRFQYYRDNGNNIYIDDINISGTVDIDEALSLKTNLNIYPNPSRNLTYVSFKTAEDFKARIEVSDVTGRIVNTFNETLHAGDHEIQLNNNLEKGVYFVRLFLDNNSFTKRVIME